MDRQIEQQSDREWNRVQTKHKRQNSDKLIHYLSLVSINNNWVHFMFLQKVKGEIIIRRHSKEEGEVQKWPSEVSPSKRLPATPTARLQSTLSSLASLLLLVVSFLDMTSEFQVSFQFLLILFLMNDRSCQHNLRCLIAFSLMVLSYFCYTSSPFF